MKLPRTIRMDSSDLHVFEVPAEPGEWAVSGSFAFAFAPEDPAALRGKARQAMVSGFLGTGSWSWSTFVSVAHVGAEEREAVVRALAAHLVERYGAPSLDAALPAAREEVAFAQDLCRDHPVNTLLAVTRTVGEDGAIRESFRTIDMRDKQHTRIWEIVPEDASPTAGDHK